MEIRLLNEEFDSEKLYHDFVSDSISFNAEYVSEETVFISETPDFPIYLAAPHNHFEDFKEAITLLKQFYIGIDREIHLNKRFWYSLFVLYKRDYIVEKYPEVLNSKKKFDNIVLKKFDWENYVYKCVLAAEYIEDGNFTDSDDEEKFIRIIYDNLDMYNYIIKYNIFRNGQFIINFLTVIHEEGLSAQMKKQIKDRPELGSDERYGRRVIFELNKNYPIITAPTLGKKELKKEIKEALALYLNKC